jgi:predicted nucleic acid-binding protein
MIIADSSALFSLLIETDQNHTQAIEASKNIKMRTDTVIIPEDVFSEIVNILGKKFDHVKATMAANFILDSKIFLIENTFEKVRENALIKFQEQPDSVSFTDCVVMAFADYFDTKDIFGFDQAFSRNNYKLLK